MNGILRSRLVALVVCAVVVVGATLVARPAEAASAISSAFRADGDLTVSVASVPSAETLEARETVMAERLALAESGAPNLTTLAGTCQFDGELQARVPMPIAEALATGEVDLPGTLGAACCRICTVGRACGNSCISARYTCRVGAGCACNAGSTGGGSFVPAPVATLAPSVSFSRQSAYPQMRVGDTTALSVDLSVYFATWSDGDLEMRVTNASEIGDGLRGWDENGLLARNTGGSLGTHSFRGLVQALAPGSWRLRVGFFHRTLGQVGPGGVYWDVSVAALPTVARLYEGWHSRWAGQSDYPTLRPGQSTDLWIRYANVGTETWTRDVWGTQVNLALNADDRTPYDLGMADGWLWDNRIATTTAAVVRPGETGEFRFRLRGPLIPGTYALNLRPVVDGTTWLEDEGVFWTIVVR